MKKFTLLLTIFLLLKAPNAISAEILLSSSEYEDGYFLISATSKIDATKKSVINILTDYENITQLSPKIIESQIMEFNKERAIIRTVVRGCVLFFCKRLTNFQTTRVVDKSNIESVTIPEGSDFEYGKMTWNISEKEGKTTIKYSAKIKPNFFVPPLIGTYFVKKSLLEEAGVVAFSIERIASEQQKDQL